MTSRGTCHARPRGEPPTQAFVLVHHQPVYGLGPPFVNVHSGQINANQLLLWVTGCSVPHCSWRSMREMCDVHHVASNPRRRTMTSAKGLEGVVSPPRVSATSSEKKDDSSIAATRSTSSRAAPR